MSDVTWRYVGWHPDRDLNPQYDGIEDVDRWGVIVSHVHDDGTRCEGSVTFDGPTQRRLAPASPKWSVVQAEPLTLDPSILGTECGLHGYIRNGVWMDA